MAATIDASAPHRSDLHLLRALNLSC
jgi:hypothetical protein